MGTSNSYVITLTQLSDMSNLFVDLDPFILMVEISRRSFGGYWFESQELNNLDQHL